MHDFYSDTKTKPSRAMLEAARELAAHPLVDEFAGALLVVEAL